MLALKENNPDFGGLLDCTTYDDYPIGLDGFYRTEYIVDYKPGFKNMLGELVRFVYGGYNYYGKVVVQNPYTLTIEAYTEPRIIDELNKLNEAFDYVI